MGARFCPACGHRLSADDAAPPPVRRPPPPREPSPESHGHAMWRVFSPALQAWLWLLALNGVVGLVGHAIDLTSPWYDASAQAVSALVVLACIRRDWPALAPLVRKSGLGQHAGRALLAMALLLVFLQAWFWGLDRLGAETQDYLEDFRNHDWPLWTAFVLVAVSPAVVEELAFRGFILHRLDGVMGPREAVVVQAAMFSVLHMHPIVFPSHFVFGLVLGVMRRWTGSLWPGIAGHFLWNAWVLVQELSAP
jgi:membrane protease YdiL (CAAX protease family)